MIEKEVIEISRYFFSQLLKAYNENEIDLFLFGSSKNYSEKSKEIDFILVVPDNLKLTKICDQLSFILLDTIKKFKKMITCFPIHQNDFISKNSQFINNIWREGINVKEFVKQKAN